MSLEIRRYQTGDHDAVFDLHNRALNAIGTHAGSGAFDDDLHHIESVYLDAGGEFLVGLVDGQIVAMCALKKDDETRAELKRMRIDPDHQRRGFGRAILDAIEQRAKDLGFTTLHLETTVQQTPAQALYESDGFREIERGVSFGFNTIRYEKQLT
jgi:ribosomal protein S18 acetylase RimI-like enzyme